MPDWWEIEMGFDPNDPADGAADADSDNYSNLDEYLLAQDPHSADPAAPVITVSVTDASAGEPNDMGVVTLSRSGATSQTLTAYYSLSGTARNSHDFAHLDGKVVFGVGESTAAITIQPIDDVAYEGTEELVLSLLPSPRYFSGSTTTGLVVMADNELQPVRVRAWSDEAEENGTLSGAFEFTRRGDVRSPLTVNYTLAGTATNGVNYATIPLSVTFAAEAASTNVLLVPVNDTNFFGPRSAQLTITPGTNYFAETNAGTAVITIYEDDKPAVQVLADDDDAREATTVRNGRFKFIRTGSTAQPLEVKFAVHGTANPGADYTELPTSVTIPPGSNHVFLLVQPVNDTESEMRETVVAVLRGGSDYTIGATNAATVFIDDNEPAAYEWELLFASAVNDTNLSVPAELVVRRRGATLTASNVNLTLREDDGTQVILPTNCYSGDVGNNSSPFLPPNDLRVWARFNIGKSEAVVRVHQPVGGWSTAGFYPSLQVTVTNLFGTTNWQTLYFHRAERLIRAQFLTNHLAEGDSNILRFSRSVPQVWSPIYPEFTLTYTVGGVATPGGDHSLNTGSVAFPGNVTTVDVPVSAITDTNSEGWESVYVRLEPLSADYRPDTRTGSNWMGALNISDPGLTNGAPSLDSDKDGMPDEWESTYGFNPFVFNDPYLDADGDGIPNLEEGLNGTNPGTRDSDSDGLDDHAEWIHGSDANDPGENAVGNSTDYVPVKLSVASCFRCHGTTLQVGQHSLSSVPPLRGKTVDDTEREQIFQFLKGAEYPVNIGGPVTADPEATYTAHILSPTNGILPEFFLDDPDGMLGDNRSVSNLANISARLIVPKVELTWQANGDNLALDDHPQTDARGNKIGKRIFVGAKTPTETDPRNTVLLKVKVTPPLANSNVWLRAFDVDDTTDETFDRDDNGNAVIDTNGRAGGDNFTDALGTPGSGQFVTNGQASCVVTLDAGGEAVVEFQVGGQPGNNYRLAGTVFPVSNIEYLQSTSPTGSNYISAYTDVIRSGFNGGLSPVLAVWRKLHLEIDSMAAPPESGPQANFVADRIAAVKPNFPAAGQSTVFHGYRSKPFQDNQFEKGQLAIVGQSDTYPILGNGAAFYTEVGHQNHVVVVGTVPTNYVGKQCQLRDDDDHRLSQAGLPLPLPVTGLSAEVADRMKRLFSPAFIQIEDANAAGFNPRQTLPFKLNEPALSPDNSFGSSLFNNVKDLSDEARFWSHLVSFGYQPELSQDGDPNSEPPLYGGSPETFASSSGFSVIFMETVRERWMSASSVGEASRYWDLVAGDIAHEIGHAPGDQSAASDHAEQAHMADEEIDAFKSNFAPASIARFRRCSSWSN